MNYTRAEYMYMHCMHMRVHSTSPRSNTTVAVNKKLTFRTVATIIVRYMRNRIITVLYSRVHCFTPHSAAAAQTVSTVRNCITIVIGRRYRVTSFLCECVKMVYSEYKKQRILYLHAQGYKSDYKVAVVAKQMSDNSLHDKDDRFSPRVKTMSPLNPYGTVPYCIYNVSFRDRLFS